MELLAIDRDGDTGGAETVGAGPTLNMQVSGLSFPPHTKDPGSRTRRYQMY